MQVRRGLTRPTGLQRGLPRELREGGRPTQQEILHGGQNRGAQVRCRWGAGSGRRSRICRTAAPAERP